MEPRSYPDLLHVARQGDSEAIVVILSTHHRYLQDVARRRMRYYAGSRGWVDADDVVQETLFRAIRSLPRFRGASQSVCRAWLRKILVRVITDTVQRPSYRHASFVGGDQAAPDPASLCGCVSACEDEESLRVRLDEAIRRLSLSQRLLLRLRFDERMRYRDIAAAVDKSEEAVRKLIQRIVSALFMELSRKRAVGEARCSEFRWD